MGLCLYIYDNNNYNLGLININFHFFCGKIISIPKNEGSLIKFFLSPNSINKMQTMSQNQYGPAIMQGKTKSIFSKISSPVFGFVTIILKARLEDYQDCRITAFCSDQTIDDSIIHAAKPD